MPAAQPERTMPSDTSIAFLKDLIDTPGPSGFEKQVQQTWLNRVADVADSVHTDAYGNTWGVLEPNNQDDDTPTVVVTGHADEIGLMVNFINPFGLLRFVAIGGVDPAILPGRRVTVHTDDGPIQGVIGAVPIHLQERRADRRVPKIETLFIDCGFASEAEAQEKVRVGVPVTFDATFARLGEHRAMSKAFDNRIGIYSAAEAFCRVAEARDRLNVRLVALSTVQEEVGCVGALFVTRTIDPDLALVVDVTHATDIPGIAKAKHGKVTLGGGPTITHGTANHPQLLKHIVATAERLEMPIQHEASSRFTGTDTDNIFRSTRGIPCGLISLPNRYMHTPAETIDLRDLEDVSQLLTETVLGLDAAMRFQNVDLGAHGH